MTAIDARTIAARLDADQRLALTLIVDRGGQDFPSIEEYARHLSSMEDRLNERWSLVRQERGGPLDPNGTGSNIYRVTALGMEVYAVIAQENTP